MKSEPTCNNKYCCSVIPFSYGRFHGYWLAAGYIYDQDNPRWQNMKTLRFSLIMFLEIAICLSVSISNCVGLPCSKVAAQRRHNGDNVTSGDRKSLFPRYFLGITNISGIINVQPRHLLNPTTLSTGCSRKCFCTQANTPHCARDWYAI